MNQAAEVISSRQSAPRPAAQAAIADTLREAFRKQRRAWLDGPAPGLEQRRLDLQTLKRLLLDNLDAIGAAINQDYGNRSRHETLFAEVIAVADGINDAANRLKKWMKPQRRHVDTLLFRGARNRVIPQPLGVVGLIIPWNFPVNLSFSQLAGAFAAGNHAMVKLSENSVALSRLLREISPRYFQEEKLMWFEETGGVGVEFSQIPFDLLMFTGSGQTGRAVMAAAAKNPRSAAHLLSRFQHRQFPARRGGTLLARFRQMAGTEGQLLIGFELKKDPLLWHAGYNDAAGVTAAFNLNLLEWLNRELGADFDPARFRHYAFYNSVAGRIEMHLLSLAEQDVNVAGQRFHFALGETLHTEHSYKFRCDEFSAIAQTAGWALKAEWAHGGFAVQLYD